MNAAWVVEGATCKVCDCSVAITQVPPGIPFDYWWYCINRACEHFVGDYRVDQANEPDWCLWDRNKQWNK